MSETETLNSLVKWIAISSPNFFTKEHLSTEKEAAKIAVVKSTIENRFYVVELTSKGIRILPSVKVNKLANLIATKYEKLFSEAVVGEKEFKKIAPLTITKPSSALESLQCKRELKKWLEVNYDFPTEEIKNLLTY